jgi:hypothetical protein
MAKIGTDEGRTVAEGERLRLLAVVEGVTLSKEKDRAADESFVWPDLMFLEFLAALAVTILLGVWALLADAPLREVANPTKTENPAKAPWYFVGLQELLVYFDPWIAGVMIPLIILAGLMAIPYLDVNPRGNGGYSFSARRFAVTHFLIGYGLWFGLILVGAILRGPNWNLVWPREGWETHKAGTEVLWSLHPALGVALVAGYLAAGLGLLLLTGRGRTLRANAGSVRSVLVTLLLLLMYAVPIKIVLRLTLGIQYVLVTPWFNV